MLVTVQVSRAAFGSPRGQGEGTPESLARLATELGVALRPLHPDSSDPTLQTYFVVDVPEGPGGHRVIERLRQDPAIAGAYVKPPEAMP